jgi:hypothetical protein
MHLAQLRVVCHNKFRGLGEGQRLVGGEEGGREAPMIKMKQQSGFQEGMGCVHEDAWRWKIPQSFAQRLKSASCRAFSIGPHNSRGRRI